MQKDSQQYQCYVDILKEELVPAMGCTEPIALAYAAAKARTVLGALPDRVVLQVSGSIIKNVKSVIVPNTGHLKGISAAAAAGIVAGVADKELEVISQVSASEQEAIKEYLNRVQIEIQHIDWGHVFDLQVTAFQGSSWAKVRITDFHTNIVLIEKDGQVLLEKPVNNTLFTGYTREYVPVLLKAPGHRQGGIVHAVLGAFDGTRCAAALAE